IDDVFASLTERPLLKMYLPLNKKPDEVTIAELLVPFFRIGPDESTKNAAKMMVQNGITRLGVFEDEKLLGWVTLTDLARQVSRPHLLRALTAHDEPEQKQILCPNCPQGTIGKDHEQAESDLEVGMSERPLLSVL